MSWRPGRGHGAVQGSAREHTPRASAREAPAPRLACQALPDPTAPTWRQHRWTAGNKTTSSIPCRASAGHAGQPRPLLGGDKTLCHQAGAVESGRAGCARRGGHRGDCAVPRRVFACPALNGATAAAWPLRGLACDKVWRSPSPTGQPLRSNARFRTIPQRQLQAVITLPPPPAAMPQCRSGNRSVESPTALVAAPGSGTSRRSARSA